MNRQIPVLPVRPGHVVVVGAGPAGLTAGLKLLERGVQVEIFEAEDHVGGLCATTPFQGRFFDLGGHRLISTDQAVWQFMDELLPEDLLVRPRKSVIYLENSYLNYPVEPRNLLAKLGVKFTLKALLDYGLTAIIQRFFPRTDSNFEQWVINRFGVTLFNLYFGPYSEKLWGLPPRRVSANWAHQRISVVNLPQVITHMFFPGQVSPKTLARAFHFPKRGIGQIPEKLAEKVVRLGGKIHLNSRVCRAQVQANHITSLTFATPEGTHETPAGDFIINTSPLPRFIEMLTGVDLERIKVHTHAAQFRAVRFLNVCLNVPRLSANTWIYVPDQKYVFFRIQDLRNWSSTIVPEGKGGIVLEIACNYGDQRWCMSDDDLWRECLTGLQDMGLVSDGSHDGYFSTFARDAYPVYSLDYDEHVSQMYAFVARIGNLRSIGRQGLFRYNNMDHSIKMGLMTASHLLESTSFQETMDIATERVVFERQAPLA
jgi:protoporphyrinogen oxidase